MCLGLFLSFSLKLRSFILIYLILCSYINCYLLTPLVYLINRNRKKDESNKNPISILLHTLVRIGPFPCLLFFFTSNAYVKRCVLSMYINKIGIIMWLYIIILRSPEKGVPWKFWLDIQFPRNSKRKWKIRRAHVWTPVT